MAEIQNVSKARMDGMLNVLGILSAQRIGFGGVNSTLYDHNGVYINDGLAATIVDKPAEDAMANGFVIEGDEEGDIINEFDRLDAVPIITDCIRWMRLHGGGAILMLVDDGLPLTEPIAFERIRRLDDLIPYSVTQIGPTQWLYNDATKKNYGTPAIYEMRPSIGAPFFVHESRLVKIGGDPMPGNATHARGIPWAGRSTLDSCYTAIKRYNDGLFLAKGILERKTQLVHKMSDLGAMLAQGLDEVVVKRINMADSARNIFNMLAVDALDDVVLADTNVGGIDAVIRDFRLDICGKTRMPMAVLFGDQAGGLNANAEGENTIYSKLLEGIQKNKIAPTIEAIARVVWAQKLLQRNEPEHWRIKFNPLFAPRATDLAEIDRKKAETKRILMEAIGVAVDRMIWLPEEARQATALAFPELGLDLSEGVLPDDVDSSEDAVTRRGGDDTGTANGA